MKTILSEIFSPQYKKPLVGLDIGSHSVKFAEVSTRENEKPKIISYGSVKLSKDIFTGAIPVKKDVLAKIILDLFEEKQVETKRIAYALPASAVFTKRISLSKSAAENLETNIAFEASNYIPHKLDAINLDYHIIDDLGAMTDVLLVGVKHDILDAYQEVFHSIGLEPVIADVSSFACQNFLEFTQPEVHKKTLALLDIGHRHITVTLLKDGKFLLSGDVGIGAKQYYDELVSALDISFEQAGILLYGGEVPGADSALVNETIDKVTESIVSELQKQMSFFWNGAGIDDLIEEVMVVGGGTQIPRLKNEIASQLGNNCTECSSIDSFLLSDSLKESWKPENGTLYGLALGLSIRRSGDKYQKVDL
jgi:type IV pilus assembly protein PilM